MSPLSLNYSPHSPHRESTQSLCGYYNVVAVVVGVVGGGKPARLVRIGTQPHLVRVRVRVRARVRVRVSGQVQG